MASTFDLIKRGWNKPPHVIGRWLWRKVKARRAARTLPRWERWLGPSSIAAALDQPSFDGVVAAMRAANPFPGLKSADAVSKLVSPESKQRLIERAEQAMRREVDFLGSGPTELGVPIDWCTDFKSETSWPMRPSLRLPINDLGSPSDIKVPWELSRLQWLLPVGQVFVLDREERHASFAREVVEEWIASNPVCVGPNWVCAMDVALRGISLVWLFHALKDSVSWKDEYFLQRLSKSLILHARFVETNLEYADVNGNHLTADLAGLTIIGIGLGGKGIAENWIDQSWSLLTREFPLQVPNDGVCREASAAYHRLVAELFSLPALARRNMGLPVNADYIHRLERMADFTAAATRPDGEVPVWGDADDGRALPLGTQSMNDHRYLVEILSSLSHAPARPIYDETAWWLGLGEGPTPDIAPLPSGAFNNAGVYIMRGSDDYVFIDAGPVGMAGRGGHGHNDCLSIEACLGGAPLVVDPGCYVYTADWRARNRFRGTGAHNTPMVDSEEINRIPRDDWLWYLENDAVPEVRHWSTSGDVDMLVASHSGYQRLKSPVSPVRAVMLEKSTHRLFVADGFEGEGEHHIRVPYTFAPNVALERAESDVWRLDTDEESFLFIVWSTMAWHAEIREAAYSPSYGIKHPTSALVFERRGPLAPLAAALIPEKSAPPDPVRWLGGVVDGRIPVPGIGR